VENFMPADYSIVDQQLHIQGELPAGFHGERQGEVWICPLDTQNAATLRETFSWTAPIPAGSRRSFGFGDRLGLATPGHIAAVRDTSIFPVLAQQSMAEMERTRRAPQQILDDVTWAVFAADYQDGYGSDADGLQTTDEIDAAVNAGFSGFTLDIGGFVDEAASSDEAGIIARKYLSLPWDVLQSSPDDLKRIYGLASFQRDRRAPRIFATDAEAFFRAACKFEPALAYTAHLARYLADKMDGRVYDLEIALSYAHSPTTPHESMYLALELRRLGVKFTLFAPCFSGFEKGVEFSGDLSQFERDLAGHMHVARQFGPYKLSLHRGSDKFKLYPLLAKHDVHIKTSGTSWLEALRVIALHHAKLMKELWTYAVECYPRDRAAELNVAQIAEQTGKSAPPIRPYDEDEMPDLLNNPRARQVLHITYGSLLATFREPIYDTLHQHLADYHEALKTHFERHLAPLLETQ
jgi:hypothetical protein